MPRGATGSGWTDGRVRVDSGRGCVSCRVRHAWADTWAAAWADGWADVCEASCLEDDVRVVLDTHGRTHARMCEGTLASSSCLEDDVRVVLDTHGRTHARISGAARHGCG